VPPSISPTCKCPTRITLRQLFLVSLLTLLSLSATIILHWFYGLSALLNTILNSTLFILWSISFALLTWWTSSTLAQVCNIQTWDDSAGIGICRIYKALFSFSLLGVISTLFALWLDIHVQCRTTHRGKFTALQNLDRKSGAQGAQQHLSDANPNPSARSNYGMGARGGEGYAVPDEQFVAFDDDDDTAYRGGAAGEAVTVDDGRL
jgi:hypothetical protein